MSKGEKMNKKKPELVDVKSLCEDKYLSLYQGHYKIEGGEISWDFSSRKKIDNVEIKEKSKNADGVRVVPYAVKDGQIILYLIRQFRYPINDYIIEFPAGMVDGDEDEEETARREVKEEIGADVLSMKPLFKNLYSSPGLTDEKITYFEAEVDVDDVQHLEPAEHIEILPCTLAEAEKILESGQNFGDTAMLLKIFLLSHK